MEQLGNLPMPALVTFGAVLAFIFGVRYFGLWQGQQHAPAASAASAQVAAVIVDSTALNRATAALEAHTAAMNKMIFVGEEMTRQSDHLADELGRIREEMRIQREVRR